MEKHYVYYFTDANDEVIYVGRTNNIDLRMSQHFGKNGHLDGIAYEEVDEIYYAELNSLNESRIYELYYISKFSPRHNTTYKEGGGIGVELTSLPFKQFNYKCNIEESLRSEIREEYEEQIKRLQSELLSKEEKLKDLFAEKRKKLDAYVYCANFYFNEERLTKGHRLTISDIRHLEGMVNSSAFVVKRITEVLNEFEDEAFNQSHS